ncbi:integrase family protein [Phytobacter diazotrophicus]|uniref:tyrosine-type recombinase/integrase n=1 Tax=Phytobacter diazotrophicus TaxID=395631 RepID=UPI002FF92BC4
MSRPKRFRFTSQLIKSLPPNSSDSRSTDAEYSDSEISGLKCLVSKGEGRKKFLLRYLYHGRKRAIAIDHWPEVDVALARKIALEHKRSLATGTDTKQERESKRKEMTFDELFNQHYLPWAESTKRSWRKDIQRYRDHIRPAIGQMLLSDITPRSILRLQQMLSISLSAATCNRVIVLIKAVFTWAGRQSITFVHPARVVQLLRENNARQRYFTEDEIRRIFLSSDKDISPVAARYVKLLLLIGLRRDELRLAKWENLDPVKRTLWLPV